MIEELKTHSKLRSEHWPALRALWLKDHPTCAACGGTTHLEVHHKAPFHLHPELELDIANFITLCEEPGHTCHFVFGHAYNYATGYNDQVDRDAANWLSRVKAIHVACGTGPTSLPLDSAPVESNPMSDQDKKDAADAKADAKEARADARAAAIEAREAEAASSLEAQEQARTDTRAAKVQAEKEGVGSTIWSDKPVTAEAIPGLLKNAVVDIVDGPHVGRVGTVKMCEADKSLVTITAPPPPEAISKTPLTAWVDNKHLKPRVPPAQPVSQELPGAGK